MNNLKFLFCSLAVTSLPVLASHEQQSRADEWRNTMAESLNQKEANRIKANAAANKAMIDENRRAIEERNREIEAVRQYNRELGKGR